MTNSHNSLAVPGDGLILGYEGKLAEAGSHVEVPSEAPADSGYGPAALTTGGNFVALGLAVAVLWKWGTNLVNTMLKRADDDRAKADARIDAERAAADARVEKITEVQVNAMSELANGLHKIEVAVVRSDEHNQAAIHSLTAAINRHETRLDRVDGRLDQHGERILTLEHGAGNSGVRPRPRAASSKE